MDRRLAFIVEGSKGDKYEIIADRVDGRVIVSCTCKGARNGNHCRHRVNLLEGIVDDLLSDNDTEVALLPAMLLGTPLASAMDRYREADHAAEAAKRNLEGAKHALARIMAQGS
jgi:hypothetical protein